MKREGYYGLILAALAILVLYLLNKAGLLHASIGGTTAVVSATVGGVPVGTSVTNYPAGDYGGETGRTPTNVVGPLPDTAPTLAPASDVATVSSVRLWGVNSF